MLSEKPYLMRAIYDWAADNHFTLLVYAETEFEGVELPEFLKEDPIVLLNCSATAVRDFYIDENAVHFLASFNGKVESICLPVDSIYTFLAQETGRGLTFRELPGFGEDVSEEEMEETMRELEALESAEKDAAENMTDQKETIKQDTSVTDNKTKKGLKIVD